MLNPHELIAYQFVPLEKGTKGDLQPLSARKR